MSADKKAIRALVIEDSENDLLLLERFFIKQGIKVDLCRVENAPQLKEALARESFEVILSDYSLPQFSGFEALRLLRGMGKDIPFIVVSGAIGEDFAVELMKAGAHDYVSKNNLGRLIPVIHRELREAAGREKQRFAEKSLRESEQRYRQLFEQSPDAIYIEQDGRVVFVNPASVKLFGAKNPTDLVGRVLLDLVHPESRRIVEEQLEQLKEGKKVVPFAGEKLLRLDGSIVEVESSMSLFDYSGQPARQVVVRDLTERRLLEAQLRHSQKMEAVGQLAAGVAHDFNNILTIIQGHIGLMKPRVENPDLREALNKVSVAADRAAALTRQLLTFSHKQVAQPQLLDLNQVLATITSMLQRVLGEDISLDFQPEFDLPFIHGDQTMMEQVLMNLAVNARDAMPRGGQLIVRTSRRVIDRSYVERIPAGREGSFICLTIQDTGSGMDSGTLSRIFEPFFTTKEIGKGTGLGLATVYAIVNQHQGWIDVNSRPGAGTRFDIYFPASRARGLPVAGHSKPVAPCRTEGSETILVVEDEPVVLDLVQELLRQYGYRVLMANSGVRALNLWELHRHEIDLLLTDLVMPDGMTGQELAERLRGEKKKLKVIFTSGYSAIFSETSRKNLNGFFLQKPYQPESLVETIRKCLDRA